MSLTLFVIVLHVFQSRKGCRGANGVALISGIIKGAASDATEDVWLAILISQFVRNITDRFARLKHMQGYGNATVQ